tara:strand:- start:84 stop:290 length:207 start_codon:yes stop_codon:yes gene_type:complete
VAATPEKIEGVPSTWGGRHSPFFFKYFFGVTPTPFYNFFKKKKDYLKKFKDYTLKKITKNTYKKTNLY